MVFQGNVLCDVLLGEVQPELSGGLPSHSSSCRLPDFLHRSSSQQGKGLFTPGAIVDISIGAKDTLV